MSGTRTSATTLGVSSTWPRDVQAVLDAVTSLGGATPGVSAVALVGSYARGAAHVGSDVDLVGPTDDPVVLASASTD